MHSVALYGRIVLGFGITLRGDIGVSGDLREQARKPVRHPVGPPASVRPGLLRAADLLGDDGEIEHSGLRLDQAAAVWHVLTSARTVEIVTGPAGTGKTRVLAAAARAWGGPLFGTATSQNATNELGNAGVRVTANTKARWCPWPTWPRWWSTRRATAARW